MEETKRRRFIIRAVLEGEVDVQDAPQPSNLFDPERDPLVNLFIRTNTMKFSIGQGPSYASTYIPVDPNTTYKITKMQANQFRIGTSAEEPADLGSVLQTVADHTGTEITITTDPSANYLFVTYWYSTSGYDQDEIRDSIVITKES